MPQCIPCGRCPPSTCPPSSSGPTPIARRCTCTRPSRRPRSTVPRGARLHPDRGAARRRSARAPHHRRARHPPDRTRTSPTWTARRPACASARRPNVTSATGSDPRPRCWPGAGLFSLGSDSHAVIDLFEEARAVELDERLARRERGIIAAERCCDAATADGQHALGWTDAGELAGRRARRPRRGRHSVDPHGGWRRDGGERRVRRIGGRRHRRDRRRSTSSSTERHDTSRSPTSASALARWRSAMAAR